MSCTGHYILTIHDAHPILPRLPGPNWVWAGIWKSGNTQTLTVVEWEGISARRWMHLRFLILLSIREEWCWAGTRTEVNGTRISRIPTQGPPTRPMPNTL